MEAAFIWPVIMGLYWKKGNAGGAMASIITGVGSYVLFHSFMPNAFGMHTVVMPVLLSFAAYVLVSLITMKHHAKVQDEVITKLWSA